MKFGKSLSRSISLSKPEWSTFWVNYKALKKAIKDICNEQASSEVENKATESPTHIQPSAPLFAESKNNCQLVPVQREAASNNENRAAHHIAKSVGEVKFFRLLRSELQKVSVQFALLEANYVKRMEIIENCYSAHKKISHANPAFVSTELMISCVSFYKDLLLLENYAVINYCGFSKILKKHDRWTGHNTRAKYMTKMVNHLSFTTYPRLQEMLIYIEKIFGEITENGVTHNISAPADRGVSLSFEITLPERFDSNPKSPSLGAVKAMHTQNMRLHDSELISNSNLKVIDGGFLVGTPAGDASSTARIITSMSTKGKGVVLSKRRRTNENSETEALFCDGPVKKQR